MVQRYPIDKPGGKCPECDRLWREAGVGDGVDATAVKQEDETSGAVSLYKCKACGHEYEVEFPVGSVFLA